MEFWNDIVTDKSWKVLINLKKKLDFILIGGWACYLLTKSIKSKDIDIITDFEILNRIKREFMLKKTPFLKKYETRIEGISVDIYVPFYSRLAIPIEEIQKNCTSLEGFKIPRPETLLILKQCAELERKDSIRGQKDRVDILNLLINGNPDMKEYQKIIKKFRLSDYPKRLKKIIHSARKEFEYLGIRDLRKIKLIKKNLEASLTKI
jgi:hypothetical protein